MKTQKLAALNAPLPDDLQRLHEFGDFERMNRLIDERLKRDLPPMLRERLCLEKEIIGRLPREYPYTMQDGERIMSTALRDYTPGELDRLKDENAADWIYIHGKPHLRKNFFSNLMITRPELAAREIDRTRAVQAAKNTQLLDDAIDIMKRDGQMRTRLTMRVSLTPCSESVRPGEHISVHLPLPLRMHQVEAVRILRCDPEPTHIAAEDYPQRTLRYHGKYTEGQSCSVEYAMDICARYQALDPACVKTVQPNHDTEEILPHVCFTPYLRALAKDITQDEKNPLLKAQRVYHYITTHINYSLMRSYLGLIDIPQAAATSLKGDCGVQALLFITLLRILGIPARWQAGLYATPLSVGNHDWAMFYIEPYGWLYADCSFGGSAYRAGAEERHAFYFGALDPYRVPLNSQFQHPFDPPMRHLRYDPYDNQDGEAELDDRTLGVEDYDTEQTVVHLEIL